MNELVKSNSIKDLNKEFCKLVGIKKVVSYIINLDTDEIRFYSSRTSKYRTPQGWENIIIGSYDEPMYPDFTNPINFTTLLEIQWQIFGGLGPQYTKISNESFPENYLMTKIKAITLCRSMGGGEMLDEYIEAVRNTCFDYPIPEWEEEDDK